MKNPAKFLYFLTQVTMFLLIPLCLELDLPIEIQLENVFRRLPFVIAVSAFLVWFTHWSMKKGGLLEVEENGN